MGQNPGNRKHEVIFFSRGGGPVKANNEDVNPTSLNSQFFKYFLNSTVLTQDHYFYQEKIPLFFEIQHILFSSKFIAP